MRFKSSRSSRATIQPNMDVRRAEWLTQSPDRGPISFTEVLTSFCVTAGWTHAISLIPQVFHHSNEINLGFRVEVQSGKTGRSSLRITKAYANRRVLQHRLKCLRMMPAQACTTSAKPPINRLALP